MRRIKWEKLLSNDELCKVAEKLKASQNASFCNLSPNYLKNGKEQQNSLSPLLKVLTERNPMEKTIEFRVFFSHFPQNDAKLRCLATLILLS